MILPPPFPILPFLISVVHRRSPDHHLSSFSFSVFLSFCLPVFLLMCHSVLVRLSSYKNTKITMQPGHLTLASPSRRACRQVEPRNHRHPCGNKKVTNLGCCEEEYVHLEPDGWQHKNPVLELINCLVHRKVKATLILSPVSIIYYSQKCRRERDGGKTLILLPTLKSSWGTDCILAATGH